MLFGCFKNCLNFDGGLANNNFTLKCNILEHCCMDTSFLKIDLGNNLNFDIGFEFNLYSIEINFDVSSHLDADCFASCNLAFDIDWGITLAWSAMNYSTGRTKSYYCWIFAAEQSI